MGTGTEAGKVFRLRNKGMPNVEGYGRGDLHVRIVPEVPVKLSSQQKKMLKELAAATGDGNYPRRQKFRKRIERFFERKEQLAKQG